MKNKTIFFAVFSFLAIGLNAQVTETEPQASYAQEDSSDVVSIADIVNIQQSVKDRTDSETHIKNVWKRQSYFMFGTSSMQLKSKKAVRTGTTPNVITKNNVAGSDKGKVKFENDWGVSLQLGRKYRLHNKPIGQMLYLNLDYSFIDLSVNHFKAESKYKYDSRDMFTSGTSSYHYKPWGLSKYEANYNMLLGPSISIAPFIATNIKELHHVHLHSYFHLGYGVSFIYMNNDDDLDLNVAGSTGYNSKAYDEMKDDMKLDFGSGMSSAFGIGISWKGIGLGYEHRSTSYKYKSLNTSHYGSEKDQFSVSTNRVYLQFNY